MNHPEKFWAKVNKTEGCWLWMACSSTGYGRYLLNGRLRLAHRVAYELCVGPIPEGLTIDHLCRTRHCVNPAHFEVVTGRVNTQRGNCRYNAQKTHCPQGHPYDAENTYKRMGGKRGCRICMGLVKKRRRAKQRLLPLS